MFKENVRVFCPFSQSLMSYDSQDGAKSDITDRACRSDCAFFSSNRVECLLVLGLKRFLTNTFIDFDSETPSAGTVAELIRVGRIICPHGVGECRGFAVCDETKCIYYHGRQIYLDSIKPKEEEVATASYNPQK